MPWHIGLILLVGALVGYKVQRRRLLLALLVGVIVLFAIVGIGARHEPGWLNVAIVVLVPLLVSALAVATLRQWRRPAAGVSGSEAP